AAPPGARGWRGARGRREGLGGADATRRWYRGPRRRRLRAPRTDRSLSPPHPIGYVTFALNVCEVFVPSAPTTVSTMWIVFPLAVFGTANVQLARPFVTSPVPFNAWPATDPLQTALSTPVEALPSLRA